MSRSLTPTYTQAIFLNMWARETHRDAPCWPLHLGLALFLLVLGWCPTLRACVLLQKVRGWVGFAVAASCQRALRQRVRVKWQFDDRLRERLAFVATQRNRLKCIWVLLVMAALGTVLLSQGVGCNNDA
jgi:hypothetical protein